ncbi:hypothetical protein [Phascolarctobacterium succinatutens]|uniref:hypothetical protein n=1 Tax=Phascolarctobacterium succinatutens TaxID=626940 RepID=UPI002EC1A055|nr:hypothetical protein [Phascolarctobacterium succinatutens]
MAKVKDLNHRTYADKETGKIQWEDMIEPHSLADSRNNNQAAGERAMMANMEKLKEAKKCRYAQSVHILNELKKRMPRLAYMSLQKHSKKLILRQVARTCRVSAF